MSIFTLDAGIAELKCPERMKNIHNWNILRTLILIGKTKGCRLSTETIASKIEEST
jgi:hypothetical protein